MEITRPSLKITIGFSEIKDRKPTGKDAILEVVTALRKWCDLAEQHGLNGNIVNADGKIIGTANLPRVRAKAQKPN